MSNFEKAEAYFDEGVQYLEKENFEKAIEAFTKVIKLDPKAVAAYFNRGCTIRRWNI